MRTKDEINLRLGNALAVTPVPTSPDVERFAAWDSPDLVAAMTATPSVMSGAYGAKNSNEAAALFAEGPRGPTARSAIAKEIAIQRRFVRFAQSLLGVELERFGNGKISERRLRTIETVADRAHKRYLASYELLLNMEMRPAPMFRISAGNAAIQVNNREATPI